jgi:single-strand DNA-binding protein
MNKFIFLGRLTKDPEVRYTTTNNTQVTTFDIAVNRKYNNEQVNADFFKITSFSKTAEFISKYFTKGRQILIEGRIQNRTWEDELGTKRYATDYIAEQVYFADSKAEKQETTETQDYVIIEDTEELPFS